MFRFIIFVLSAIPVAHAGCLPSPRLATTAALPKVVAKKLVAAVNPAIVTATGTVTISSSDPDTPSSSTATVNWTMDGNNKTWSISVQSLSATLGASCPAPLSAVQFTCTNLTIGGSGNRSGACAGGPTPLTTSLQTVASGSGQGNGGSASSVTVSFSFTDLWKYIAGASCSVSLNYSVTAN